MISNDLFGNKTKKYRYLFDEAGGWGTLKCKNAPIHAYETYIMCKYINHNHANYALCENKH